MANTPVFTMRLPPGIRGALAQIATHERRSVANLIVKVLEEYIEDRGFMSCPDCDGTGINGTDEEGEPEFCDTCNALGYVGNGTGKRQSRLSPTVAEK